MFFFEIKRSNPVHLRLSMHRLGQDLVIVISGGDSEHIGAATLSIPSVHAKNDSKITSNTSILSVTGHKEDILFREIGAYFAENFICTAIVCGGIHVDSASDQLVDAIIREVREMAEEAKEQLKVSS